MTVRLEAIQKRFDERAVLKDISCEFPDGQISTVLGVSGCGKTTLLRIIAGLEEPDEGAVYIGAENVTRTPPQQRNLGMVFQDLALYSHLTVQSNLLMPLLARGVDKELALKKVEKMAHRFGIGSFLTRRASSLSGGEAQRLALGRAIIREPKVMLLDEPFSHLDAPLQREARQFIFSELRAAETTAVLVTHNHQDAQEAGGKVVFMDQGRIVQSGAWEDLYRRPVTPRVAKVVSFLEPLSIQGVVKKVDNRLIFWSETLGLNLDVNSRLAAVWDGDEGTCSILFRPEDLVAKNVELVDKSDVIAGSVVSTFLQGSMRFCRLSHHSGLIVDAVCGDDVRVGQDTRLAVWMGGVRQLLIWRDPTEEKNPA
ncbi:MAG: ABC transporter ATP-binding protein [Acidobacteria bacterium]|nr:ABC transporter ATP-binding protein [Acidobacteriota bacterium]